MKMSKFCVSKDYPHRAKRQPTEWKKMFANHIFDEGIILWIRISKTQQQKQLNSITGKGLE